MSMVIYHGKIHFFKDFDEINLACLKLISKVEEKHKENVPMTFDMEWNFNFASENGKTALIQICIELEECFLQKCPNDE